jgi:hypothetical protein
VPGFKGFILLELQVSIGKESGYGGLKAMAAGEGWSLRRRLSVFVQ